MLRHQRQARERELHRAQPGVVDVDAVDLVDLDDADADRRRTAPNLHVELDAPIGVERLRVVDAVDLGPRREDHRRGDDRAGERSHADLVDAGDVHDAGLPQQPFEMQHRVEPQPFLALLVGAFGEQLVEFLHAGARVALQLGQQLGGDGGSRVRVFLLEFFEREFRQGARHGLFCAGSGRLEPPRRRRVH